MPMSVRTFRAEPYTLEELASLVNLDVTDEELERGHAEHQKTRAVSGKALKAMKDWARLNLQRYRDHDRGRDGFDMFFSGVKKVGHRSMSANDTTENVELKACAIAEACWLGEKP